MHNDIWISQEPRARPFTLEDGLLAWCYSINKNFPRSSLCSSCLETAPLNHTSSVPLFSLYPISVFLQLPAFWFGLSVNYIETQRKKTEQFGMTFSYRGSVSVRSHAAQLAGCTVGTVASIQSYQAQWETLDTVNMLLFSRYVVYHVHLICSAYKRASSGDIEHPNSWQSIQRYSTWWTEWPSEHSMLGARQPVRKWYRYIYCSCTHILFLISPTEMQGILIYGNKLHFRGLRKLMKLCTHTIYVWQWLR